jgi:hypothetical protein
MGEKFKIRGEELRRTMKQAMLHAYFSKVRIPTCSAKADDLLASSQTHKTKSIV